MSYDPKSVEQPLYKRWEESGYFNPDNLPGRRRVPFSIAMPPPNATGILHNGHALVLTVQDILTRYHRMKGEKALWLPGTDHAAIATQNVMEQQLKAEGKTKLDLGRTKFLQSVDAFVEKTRGTITTQIRRMGASTDWSRERFTMDAGLSVAVNTAFTELYNDGLIYRGTRVVNWCARCQSTLSDDEVKHREEPSTLYTFRYDKSFPVAIATTRPETKFGDTGVAVNPEDDRYRELVGKEFTVNFAGVTRTIRVVAEPGVDRVFGTGVLGVTPAHSSIDEAIARREKLLSITVIGKDGAMTTDAGPMVAGLTTTEARQKVVAWLREQGLLDSEQEIQHNLAVCYRCGTPIEPMPLEQWFVAVDKPTKRLDGKSLKQRALEVVEKNEITFVPDRFTATYKHWMENLHDWCISRQIWYGHRIPVWYHGEKIYVGVKPPKGKDWAQDPDTLDTWFSSGMWTFSTLGWPKKTADLKKFHPTSILETGYDIIFFWVARMILMSTYFMQEVPFRTVYLHGLVLDEKGQKMSKSVGNGLDPLRTVDQYGADALRLALIVGTAPGNDQRLSMDKVMGQRNFVNKLWNVSKYIAIQPFEKGGKTKAVSVADKWVMARLAVLTRDVTEHLDKLELSTACEKLVSFLWHDVADWYVEIHKFEKNTLLLRQVFEQYLHLLHPFAPFITEELWQALEPRGENDFLMVAPWPKLKKKVAAEPEQFARWQATIRVLRNFRLHSGFTNGEPASIEVKRSNPPTDYLNHLTGITFITGPTQGDVIHLGFSNFRFPAVRVASFSTWREQERADLGRYIASKETALKNDRLPENVRQQFTDQLADAKKRLTEL